MATTIDVDETGTPTGTTQTIPVKEAFTQPMKFNAATTFQSPFFWIVVGAGIAALSYYLIKRKSVI